MKNEILDIVILLFANLCAGLGQYAVLILGYLMFESMNNDFCFKYCMLYLLAILLFFGRLFILPFTYKIVENSQQYRLCSKIVYILKNSIWAKIFVLIWAHCAYFLGQINFFNQSFFESIRCGILLGLSGSYIILFIYWWIEDIIRKLQHKLQ
ncbi:MAG: hypothetical protein NC191_05260 [Muribaculaceae bacterium]|nr:hypothetical protein [Muribaculaceae bacterium]